MTVMILMRGLTVSRDTLITTIFPKLFSDTVAVDSVVYEPSKEELLVSEGPGLDNHVASGPETLSPGLLDRLNTPGVENFAGVGPVEPSPVLPHTSDPPVADSVFVSGSHPPVPEFRFLLKIPHLSNNSAPAAEDFFPEPGSRLAWPGVDGTFRLRLGGGGLGTQGGSERAPPEPGGVMRSREKLCTGYRIPSQGSGNMLFWPKLVRDFRDGFGDIYTVDLAFPCLHKTLLIGLRTDCFHPQWQGMRTPRMTWRFCVSLLHNLSGPLLPRVQRPRYASSSRMTLSYVLCPVCFYVIDQHWVRVIQLVSSGTLAGMMGVAVAHDNAISLSRLGGGRSQYSDWLLIVLQWAGLDAPPINVLGHTVVFSRGYVRGYI